MPEALPFVDDGMGQPLIGAGAQVEAGGVEASGSVGVAPTGTGGHNTHLWVAAVIFFALAVVVGLHITGFRFATDIGITGR